MKKRPLNSIFELYQALLDLGVNSFAAKELTSQQVSEGGYGETDRGLWWTGDKKKYATAQELANHIVDWYGRMYPKALKAEDFNTFYDGLQKNRGYMYNSKLGYTGYRNHLLKYRPAILKRLNNYDASKVPVQQINIPDQPMSMIEQVEEKPDALRIITPSMPIPVMQRYGGKIQYFK